MAHIFENEDDIPLDYVFDEDYDADEGAGDYLSDEDFANLPAIEQERVIRMEQLQELQRYYKDFNTFLLDAMIHLGFSLSKVQADIGKFMAYGPKYLMVQAQRSQAKTTIAAAFCVWTLIHDPRHRILIISAGGDQADDISKLVTGLIMDMDVLECMRPDKSKGDRVSVKKFDVHYSLRKLDKSASVSCCGITANLQGRRADLLLADDIESQKNSLTALMREQLLAKTLDFISINQSGRILYLGTPQSSDSIYNTLAGRGYAIRIWPGRFPTAEQRPYYGEFLAPMLDEMSKKHPELLEGGGANYDQGRPIEPSFLGEELLQAKERDQGPSWFQLQHMLNTKLMDAERYPLKPENIVVLPIRPGDQLPYEVKRGFAFQEYQLLGKSYRFALAHSISPAVDYPTGINFYIDPAGGGKGKGTHGGDETGWACTAFLNGNIFCLGYGGVKGGYDETQLDALARLVAKFKPNTVTIEKNYGFGAFAAVFLPILRKHYTDCELLEDMVGNAQKEIRIIDTLEPIIARGSLIMAESAIKGEPNTLTKHPEVNRITYMMWQQMSLLTREKDSLVHDDRLDALAGSCAHWEEQLKVDQEKVLAARAEAEMQAFWRDPLGHNRYRTQGQMAHQGKNNMLAYRRNQRR